MNQLKGGNIYREIYGKHPNDLTNGGSLFCIDLKYYFIVNYEFFIQFIDVLYLHWL